MAQTGKVIAIPVQFKEAGNTMAQIMQTLQKAVREVDLESNLGKKVKSMMDSLQSQLDDYTQLTLEPTIDQTSLRKAERMLQTFAQRAGKIDSAISSGSVFDFNLSKAEIDDISGLTAQVRELNAELVKLKKNGSNRATDSYLQEIGEGALLDRARKASRTFKSDASLGKNQTALEAETKQARDNIARLQAEQATLQQQADAIKAKLAQQQTTLRDAQRARDRSKAVTDTGNFLTQFESFNYKSLHTESGQLRGQTAVLNKFMDALMKDSEGGRIAEHNRHGAEMVLRQLGMDPAAIETVLSQQGPQIRAAIARALDITDTSSDMISEETYDRLRRVQSSANSYMRRHATDARYVQYEQEQQAVRDAQADLDRTQTDFNKANKAVSAKAEEVRSLQAMATELESVTQALANFADTLNQLEVTQLQGKIDNAEAALEQKKNEIKNSHTGKTNDLPAQRGDLSDYRKSGMDVANREQEAIDETKQFTENLKQSIRHWMSAQQVVNLIKDGVRAALRDVQNLDKAMTNIAVVTDMSVGDLWGKINEYMSIAQQYGVSTQGVYEVSQLYYQQGLSTAEVMAATTETLKMARIAGMDYAEAADAMTVAIRAFKMEMTDAQHITDVYSKVAAVTASDTEELAIAMSKTASSAESVGSSFENTTAMLAVMIETTRESAQNLGSALKSIISRYGEMKVGLTVDSEGEEIDYNKVDTALKSVGISIKDAQGQFRDFDDVIFELSEKWDSLDKNTQRYIATIMAGNRQQSRFIALVDNWERLDEVTGAAANSQDAGLLQYSKTLDSLETKLTNIKTSFQQFYMSIINGPVISFFLELGNSILQAFNKLGAIQSIFNVLSWIRTIKMLANLIFKGFEGPITKIVTSYKQRLEEMTRLTGTEAFKAGQIYAQQFDNGMNSRTNGRVARRMQNGGYSTPDNQQQNALFGWGKHQKMGQAISIGGQLAGTALSSISTATANSNAAVSTWTGVGGNIASMASMGAALGPWGAAAGALLGAATSLHEVADIEAKQAQIDYENAQKAADDANIKRAETKNNSDTLKSLIDQYKVADKNKNDSQENYDNWLSLNQQLADMYPALISYMDEEGNAIVNITEASLLLEDAFKKTTSATLDYYNKEILKRRAENAAYGATEFEPANAWGTGIAMLSGSEDQVITGGLGVVHEANGIEGGGEIAWDMIKGIVDAQDNASVKDLYSTFGDLMEYVRYLQGVSSDKQYTIDGVTYIDAGNGKSYGADWAAQGLLQIGVIQYDEESGAYSLSDAAKEYDPNFGNSAELRGLLKARSLQHLSNLSNESFMDDSLAGIEGFNGFYYHYLKTIKDLSDDQIALLTDISYDDYLSPISIFYNQLDTTNKNLFNGLISNINDYSFNTLKNLLQTLEAPEKITATFEQQWQQSNNQWQILLARQYAQQAGRDPNLIFHWNDFESFSRDFGDGRMNGHDFADSANGDVQTAWLNYLAQYAPDNQKHIFGNLNAAEAQKYLSWYSDTSDLDNSIGVEKDVTRSRRNWIIERYNETLDPNSAFARLDEAQRAEFRELLLTDDGSAEWANKIQQYAQQYGIDITGLAGIEQYVFENLSTRTAQFTDSVSSYTEKIKKLTDKQKDGYTMSEAQALAELRGMPLLDLFEVNESGLLVLKDLRAEQARVLQEELEKGRKLKEKYRITRDRLLNADAAGYSQRSIIEQAINAETEEETMSLLSASIEDLLGPDAIESLGIDGELAKQLTMEIRNGTIKTYEDFIAYLEKQLELLEITEDQYNKITAELQNEQDRIKFGEKYQADISATGLDKLFGGTLIDADGVFTASWGRVNEAGELLITDYEGLIEALTAILGEDSELLAYWKKQIKDYQIKKDQEKFSETYNVSVSATGLDTVFGGTLIDAEGVFNADWGSVDAAGNLLINDYEALLDALAEVLGEDSEAFRAWRKAIIAQSADVEKDVNKSLVDVISKMQLAKMYGLQRVQLTNDEVKALYESYAASVETPDDFDSWADHHGFWQTGTGYEFETAYASGEYNYQGHSWNEFFYSDDGWLGVAGALDTATTTALYEAKADLIKTIEGLNLDSDYSSVKKFFDAGILTEEQYQAFFTSGQTAYEYLMSILSQSANEEIQAAVKKAKDEVALEEALELDSSRLNLEDNFVNLFQNISETSLKDIQSIYEQIYGEDSFTPEIAARYQTALDQAREGTVQPLINLLYELANMANSSDKGLEVDTAKLNSVYKDANNSLISGLVKSLSSGISGTLSNVDFDNLIEQIGGVPEAYRKYVTETYDGLEISAEGVLAITNELIAKFGNSDAIINGLVDQFKGGDFLGSYIDIDRLIQEIESDTENWTEETQATLDILYKMRNVYSQMANDEVFDIMGYDPFDGAADNYYKYQQSVTEVAETLDGVFKTGEKMSEQDFHSMMGWFKNFIPKGFNATIGETNVTLGQFADAVQKTAKAGKVDISAAAQSLGITMDDISSTMDVGLKDFANKQVAYWESYLKFLEGIKELDKVSDDLKIKPPKLEFDDEGNLTAEARAAFEAYLKTIYDAFNNSGVEQYMGANNPLNQLWQHLGWGDTFNLATVPKGMEAQALQYVSNLANWFTQNFDESNITDVIGKDNQVDIPFESFINITPSSTATTETSGTPADATAPIQDAVQKTIESWGFKPDGAGGYVYELNGITMKIALGADGTPVGLDLTNASGNPPTAAEMAAIFGNNPNFSAGTDGSWTFKDATTGIVYKCSNGKVTIDSSGFTAPPTTPASEIEALIKGAGWNQTTEGGVTKYSTTVNGWKFEYTAGAEDIKVTKPGALAPESFTIADLLNGNLWIAATAGTSYTQDTGWQFEYSATTKSITVKSPTGLVEEIDIAAPDFKNGWVGNGTTYTKELNGYTFTYNKSTSTLTVSPPSAPVDPDLSTILTEANGWSGGTAGSYTKTLNGVTLNYNAITGQFSTTAPEGGPTTTENISEVVKAFFGNTATYANGVITFSDGTKINMNASKGSLLSALQTGTAQGYSLLEIATAFFGPGVTCEGNVITLPSGATIDLDATIGEILAAPEEEGATKGLSTEDLVKQIFGEGAVYDSATGTVTMPDGVKIDLNATLEELSLKNPNTTDGSYSIVLTPDTGAIDTVLDGYNNRTINLKLSFGNGSSIKNNPYFASILNYSGKVKSGDEWTGPFVNNASKTVEEYQRLVNQLSTQAEYGILSSEDLATAISLGESLQNIAGIDVSKPLEQLRALTDQTDQQLSGLMGFAEAFSSPNLFSNLTALTNLIVAISNPALATLDLTNFIAQVESMGELELDDEEINLVATAAQALADALLPLKDASINPTVSVNTSKAYTNLENLKKLYDAIKTKTVTVSVDTQYNGGDGGGDGGGTEENPGEKPATYTGNVSGLALAKGNATKKLLAGAHLAGKTLVGELGPELAVYDNQYHLLGRNGAEFVDLPKDAIVFNHRQTAGIVNGQAGYRGKALVNGNVEGPAAASGIDAAIETVKGIIQLWKNVADSSLSDMLDAGGGGGGGSGNTIKAVTEELQEWYNLSRQIEHIEQEINNLIAERSNLLESDGAAYLRSLREEQSLLREQVATQQTLLDYQKLQLKRQADQINQNDIWSKFLEVDENGLLQYKNGNEANGGKGALEVLQGLNKMSGEGQIKYITETLGYSYTTADGKELEGKELVKQFFQEFQDQIDSYDSLYDTVHQTEEKLQKLATNIEKINQEIKKNQMELEQDIFDILVEAWEAEIETLEEQKELIEEANKAYIDSLQEALQTERDMYSDNERLADREQLQRQLSLLRRSGGSASEIASLEEQLDSMLKEEYFSKQEEMIQNISDANDEQIRLLEEQIRLEEESLEYQKENGILWSRVYDIMSGSSESILAFMQGNKTEFFTQSALQQEQMLTEWAKKVGIYTENRQYEQYEAKAKEEVWDTGAIWQQDGMGDLKSTYEGLSSEGQNTIRNQFASAYASARIAGKSHEEALAAATDAVKDTLEDQADIDDATENNKPPTNDPNADGSETWYVKGPGKLNLRKEASKNSDRLGQYSPGTAMKVLKKDGDWYKVEVDGKTGWVMSQYLTKTKPGGDDDDKKESTTQYRQKVTLKYNNADGTPGGTVTGKGVADSKWTAQQIALRYAKAKIPSGGTLDGKPKYEAYSKGGLVDYTGLALVHGKPGQPEAFLNAKQTALISEAVKSVGDGGALDGIKATLTALNNTIKSITNNNNIQSSSFTVAPGAVTIQVAQLNDSYDVEELSKDVMNRMVAIASKSTNRGVNRR